MMADVARPPDQVRGDKELSDVMLDPASVFSKRILGMLADVVGPRIKSGVTRRDVMPALSRHLLSGSHIHCILSQPTQCIGQLHLVWGTTLRLKQSWISNQNKNAF